MKIVERIPAHYAVQEVDKLGRAYRWCPERAVVECVACGKRTTFNRSSLITSIVACECGATSTAHVREELLDELPTEDQVAHPWRYWQSSEEAGIPV
jgi:hypothetical protein